MGPEKQGDPGHARWDGQAGETGWVGPDDLLQVNDDLNGKKHQVLNDPMQNDDHEQEESRN